MTTFPISFEAVQHDEVVVVPVEDAGILPVVPEFFSGHLIGVDDKTVMLRREIDVFGLAAVTGHAAVQTQPAPTAPIFRNMP